MFNFKGRRELTRLEKKLRLLFCIGLILCDNTCGITSLIPNTIERYNYLLITLLIIFNPIGHSNLKLLNNDSNPFTPTLKPVFFMGFFFPNF